MTSALRTEVIVTEAEAAISAIPLVRLLCDALRRESIRYCHWKSNNALDRSAAGDNDLDLLVAREDTLSFLAVLTDCGFKAADAPYEKQMPGVQDYFGYDFSAHKWVHVHAHFQLVAGHDFSKNYRIPVERAFLDSAVDQGPFRVPTVEFEFMVFVLRMSVKHSTWDAIIGRDGNLKASEARELSFLQERIDKVLLNNLIQRHLPFVGTQVFWEAVAALSPNASVYSRMIAAHKLQLRLRPNARRSKAAELALRFGRRVRGVLRRYVKIPPYKYRLRNGGMTIAVVGGDGAGKSTALQSLEAWLSRHFETTSVHLGKPKWSVLTILIRSLLKVGYFVGLYGVEVSPEATLHQQSRVSPGYPWLLREVCRARDRFRTYRKAMRTANKGGIVLFDRFPVESITIMDGPLSRRFVHELAESRDASDRFKPGPESGFANRLVRFEEGYYCAIAKPDLLIVLLVDPEIAVLRKTDEREQDVRQRSTEVWKVDWHRSDAHVVDASKSKQEVFREIQQLIWAQI